jgi:hypothetical protein
MVSRFSEGTNDAFALRDFEPAYDRCGSLAADRYAIGDRGMSASRRKRTISRSARQVRLVPEPAVSNRSKSKLFDHLVDAGEQRRRI